MYKQMTKCSVETINEKLKYLKANGRVILCRAPEKDELIGRFKVFLFTKVSTVHLIYKDIKGRGVVKQLTAKLDVEFDGNTKNGAQALNILSHYYKAPETNGHNDAPFSVGIAPYRNPKYIGKRTPNCFGYDLNSAYPFGMLQDLPNTEKPLPPGIVGKNEYSFNFTGGRAAVGSFSMYRFEIMKTPYEKFVKVWYNKKVSAKNIKDPKKALKQKNEAKFTMNAAIGALQNHNCFLRAAIIKNFQKFINDIVEKYKPFILSTNTDSIVSIKRIPELEENLGDGIGQWKLEHEGDFAIHPNGFSVQWNRDIPAFGAGIPKAWFKEGYDILKDPLPEANNIYYLDIKKKMVLRRG